MSGGKWGLYPNWPFCNSHRQCTIPVSSRLLDPSSTATVLGNFTTKDEGNITAFGGVLIRWALKHIYIFFLMYYTNAKISLIVKLRGNTVTLACVSPKAPVPVTVTLNIYRPSTKWESFNVLPFWSFIDTVWPDPWVFEIKDHSYW